MADDCEGKRELPLEILEHVLRMADFQTLLQARRASKGFDEMAVRVLWERQDAGWNMLLFAQMAVRAGVDYEENARGSDYYEGIRALIKRGRRFDLEQSINAGCRRPGFVLPTPETFDVGIARAMYTTRRRMHRRTRAKPGFTTILYSLQTRVPFHRSRCVPTHCYIPSAVTGALEMSKPLAQRARVLMIAMLPKIVERDPGFHEIRTGDSYVRPALVEGAGPGRLWRPARGEKLARADLQHQPDDPPEHPAISPEDWVYRTPTKSRAKRQRTKK